MKCEICKKNEAAVHFKQVHDGEVKEMYLCEECAAQKGFDIQSPMPLADLLFGVGVQHEIETAGGDKECPACHMRGSDFRKTSRLGCSVCYETFSDELMPFLAGMHKSCRHVGKVPAGEKVAAEITSLQKTLEEAVASQNFEEAARLRDLISELRKAGDKKENGN